MKTADPKAHLWDCLLAAMSAAQMAVLTADQMALQMVDSKVHLWDCLLAAMSAAQMAALTADRKALQ